MRKLYINFISILLLIIGFFWINLNILKAGHTEWHEGPSCGDCHCQLEQACTAHLGGGCSCLNTEEKQLK